MRADSSLECLSTVANAIDQAISMAKANGVTPVAALLSRMSRELAEHRDALRILDEEDEEDAGPFEDRFAPLAMSLGGGVAPGIGANDESNVETVPQDTRWSFSCTGFHFRVCAFRVLDTEDGREVPVTLLWRDAAGAEGRVACPDVQSAFRQAAQLIATATLWSQIAE